MKFKVLLFCVCPLSVCACVRVSQASSAQKGLEAECVIKAVVEQGRGTRLLCVCASCNNDGLLLL